MEEYFQDPNKHCEICCEKLDKGTLTLDCQHTFHYECIIQSFLKSRTVSKRECPYCRKRTSFLPLPRGSRHIPTLHGPLSTPSGSTHTGQGWGPVSYCGAKLATGWSKGQICKNKGRPTYNGLCKIHYLSQHRKSLKQLKLKGECENLNDKEKKQETQEKEK